MPSPIDLFGGSQFRTSPLSFWHRIAADEDLSTCDALEKLLAGCELIAAIDDAELLAA